MMCTLHPLLMPHLLFINNQMSLKILPHIWGPFEWCHQICEGCLGIFRCQAIYSKNDGKFCVQNRIYRNICYSYYHIFPFICMHTRSKFHFLLWQFVLWFQSGVKIRNLISLGISSYSQSTLLSIPAWISNYIHCKVWGEITYPFPNFNGSTIEVWEWMSNFILHFTGHVITYPWWD